MPLPLLLGPALTGFLTSLVTWIFRKVVIAFLLATSIYFLIDFLGPLVLRLLGSYLNANPAALLDGIPQNMWFFLSAFRVGFGLKLMISALATRFLIRRIPFIG